MKANTCIVTCGLVAKLVDNIIRENLSTKVDISVINSSGYLSIGSITEDGANQSTYELTLLLSNEISSLCHCKKVCELISVALSISNPRVLLSRKSNGNYLKQSVVKSKKIPKDNSLTTTNGKLIRIYEVAVGIEVSHIALSASPIVIDEKEFLKTLKGLLNIKKENRTYFEENIVEAVNNYVIASNGNDKEHLFEFLYIALEKAANADKDRQGKTFDKNVSQITGINEKIIKEYREFNDRVKHSFKNEEHRKMYESYLKTINILNLKKAADTVIKHWIKEYESRDIR